MRGISEGGERKTKQKVRIQKAGREIKKIHPARSGTSCQAGSRCCLGKSWFTYLERRTETPLPQKGKLKIKGSKEVGEGAALFSFWQSHASRLHDIFPIVLWRNKSWISCPLQESWRFISASSLPRASPSCPPLRLTPDSFVRHLQPQHLEVFGCTSRTRFPLCSGSARTPGESVAEVALPCSKGRWWHTYADLLQLGSGGLVMQSVTAGQVVQAWVFNPLWSSLGGHLCSQIFCYKLCLQWLSKTIPLTFFWLTLSLSSLSPALSILPLHHKSLARDKTISS